MAQQKIAERWLDIKDEAFETQRNHFHKDNIHLC